MSRGNRILLAGGAGYIGAHVAKALFASGYQPVVYDNLTNGHRDFVKWGPLVEADLVDRAALRHALSSYGIDAVIYLAGYIEVGESVRDPLKYYDNNVARACLFLQTVTESGIEAVVFSSSAAVYGEPSLVPIPIDHDTRPVNPYGRTKLMVEQMLRDLSIAGPLRSFCLRYFNAAGADREGQVGEDHRPETHLIPRACHALLGNIPPLEIFGDDYPTADGTAIRDYIHVDDLATAHVRAVEILLEGDPGGALNVGTGRGHSVLEILAALQRATGQRVPHSFAPRRAGDPAVLVADPGETARRLNWQPEVSGIDQIVSTAWAWHRSRHRLEDAPYPRQREGVA